VPVALEIQFAQVQFPSDNVRSIIELLELSCCIKQIIDELITGLGRVPGILNDTIVIKLEINIYRIYGGEFKPAAKESECLRIVHLIDPQL
jgi:hypothetical protein